MNLPTLVVAIGDSFYRWQSELAGVGATDVLAVVRLYPALPGTRQDPLVTLTAYTTLEGERGRPALGWLTTHHPEVIGLSETAARARLARAGLLPKGPEGSLNKAMREAEKAHHHLAFTPGMLTPVTNAGLKIIAGHLRQAFAAAADQRSGQARFDDWMAGYEAPRAKRQESPA